MASKIVSPSSKAISRTMPGPSASTTCSIFSASSTATGWRFCTTSPTSTLSSDQHALQWCRHGGCSCGADDMRYRRFRRRRCRGGAFQRQYGERVVRVDLRAGLADVRLGFEIPRSPAIGGKQLRRVLLDVTRVDASGGKRRRFQQCREEAHVAARAFDLELGQGAFGFSGRGRQVVRVRDDLGQQRVVVRAGGVARVAEAVDPDAGSSGWLIGGEHAAAGT